MISGARRVLNWISPEDANTNANGNANPHDEDDDDEDAPVIPIPDDEESNSNTIESEHEQTPSPEHSVSEVHVPASSGNGGIRDSEENGRDRRRTRRGRRNRREDEGRRPEDDIVPVIPPRLSDVGSGSEEVSRPTPPPMPVMPIIPVREHRACFSVHLPFLVPQPFFLTGRSVRVEEVSESPDGSTSSDDRREPVPNQRAATETQTQGRGYSVSVFPQGWGGAYVADGPGTGAFVRSPMRAPMFDPHGQPFPSTVRRRDEQSQRSTRRGSRGPRTVYGGESVIPSGYADDRRRNSFDGELLFWLPFSIPR